jgi:hypothetical protein
MVAPKPKITVLQYDEMLLAQGGRCLLCNKLPSKKRRMSLDHDHLTGRVRGLIHQRENRALGAFEYNDEVLTRLLEYVTIILRDHKKHKKENINGR